MVMKSVGVISKDIYSKNQRFPWLNKFKRTCKINGNNGEFIIVTSICKKEFEKGMARVGKRDYSITSNKLFEKTEYSVAKLEDFLNK
ncbi:hypothetical protein Dtox_3927 [Desulfofarcimen acetoxidans DSM 771]|uniref:Uncharacterized protein n=1 Tax=Desulfofarcimen acetoxidans (strain ATCC 49208 / DSM 771 / KCTC 5769 / VKM B-1644 / 5575) TaxID=485916 RepID=C8VXZ1_DESAS|nr:hypothetical protein [Desulfofarcimen acetoxidans]ACV64620.1 hypothetical protein Dtox_3927 [Desulfofarcimen acetoxidans DSM 771]